MRVIIFDQHEFEHPDSEEMLIVAVGAVKIYKNFRLFYRKSVELCEELQTCEKYVENLSTLKRYPSAEQVQIHLADFMDIDVIQDVKINILFDQWNEKDILIRNGEEFLRYAWFTSA